jgi:hypothetical protein
MSSILNIARCKKLIHDKASARKGHDGKPKFTQISKEFMDKFEADMMQYAVKKVEDKIHRHRGSTKTLIDY